MGKKGVVASMIFIVLFFFIMSMINLISLTAWDNYNTIIQSQNDSTISPEVKQKIDSFSSKMFWADDVFAFSYFLMMIAFLITAKTASKAQPEFIIVLIGLLVVLTILSMIIANTWQFLIGQPTLSGASGELTFTTFIMEFYPIITLIITVLGGLLFYIRKDEPGSIGGSGLEGFIENDGFMRGGKGDNFE